MPSGDVSLDFDIIVKEAYGDPLLVLYYYLVHTVLDRKFQANWIVERCASREALDTCSHFAEFKTKKFCNLLMGTDKAWSSFADCVKPKFQCPLKKVMGGLGIIFDSKYFSKLDSIISNF